MGFGTGGATGAKAAPASPRAAPRLRRARQRQAPTAVLGAGPGPSQRQPADTMLTPASLRPTSRRTGFRAPGGAGVRLGPAAWDRGALSGARAVARPASSRPPAAMRAARRPLPVRAPPPARLRPPVRSPVAPPALRWPLPLRRECPRVAALLSDAGLSRAAAPVRADRGCPTRRSAGPRGARPQPRRWPR